MSMTFREFLDALFADPPPRPPTLYMVPQKVIPAGWPPFYDRTVNDAGKFVVTVKCSATGRIASTSLPAWMTEEECREDAWFRHADDPRPELVDE